MSDPQDRSGVNRTWQEAQRLKDELFERAKFGKISGEQADAEAERLGLGKLSQSPDPAEFDPGRETYWTLVMAVAWIAWRSKDKVREVWGPWRKAWWEWIPRRWRIGPGGEIHEGWFLEQWEEKSTLALLGIGEVFDRETNGATPIMSIKDATADLWIALREGFFDASGIPLDGGLRAPIPAIAWHELKAYEGRGHIDEVRFSPMGTGFGDVLVPSRAVLGFWREPKPNAVAMPPLVPPAGDGYMPLYCAAQWIATKGGAVAFDPEDESVWRASFEELLAAVSSDKVRAVGISAGQRELVPGYAFAGVRVDYPFGDTPMDLLSGDDLYLRSYPYLDEENWRKGFHDALMNRWKERWTHLMVEKGDVRTRWPFGGIATSSVALETGLPGRPAKSKHLIEAEMRRRAEAGRQAATLAEEAKALRAWLVAEHPEYPPPTAQTIANNVRDEYRSLKPTK